MNRHNRRAIKSVARRMARGIARAKRTFDTPAGAGARIHVSNLWKRYVELTGDTRVL